MLLTSTKFWIDHRTSVCALCANNTRIGTVLLLARRFTVLAMLCTVFALLAVDEVQCWRELPALDWAIHCTQIFTALRSLVHCFQRPSLVQVCQGGAAFVPWNIQQTSTLTRNLIFQALPLIGSPPNTFYQTRVRSLAMLVTHSLTHSLTDSLLFSQLDWCDPGVWRCQLNTCWGCYHWCWETYC